MAIAATHTKVLIVGAGPSGLMMAAQLLRYGVQPVIIDSKQGPTSQSKALAVQARSLEIFRQMGLIDKVLAGGVQAKGLSFNEEGRRIAELSLTDIGTQQTLFPFVHLFQQSKTERLLLDYLTVNCCPVYWNTTMVSVSQNDTQAEVQLQSEGQLSAITCDWLIGADGAHSSVRKQLHISFSGDTYRHQFYLADVELDNKELDPERLAIYLSKKGFAAFFLMPEKNCFRIVGSLPDGAINKDNITLDDVLPGLSAVTGYMINVVHNNWFTLYRLHHRMADKYREQRCFLIGDAAHIHSPVGGQGMNTGLQDAYNLAWKLAGVVNGQIKEGILNSYAAERMPVAKDLLKTTDKVFNIIVSNRWAVSLFKKWVLPKLLNFVWGSKKLREAFFKRLSQTNISYRDSAINLDISQNTKLKAGDRLPYLKVFDEKKQEETDLHQWCSKPGFVLLVLGKFDELYLFQLAKWITQKYAGNLNFFYLPPSGKNIDVFNALETKPHRQKAIIIRPDMHIGFISDAVDMHLMDNYLQNVVGFK
jgi:2-polyprenyl-6-methoxyphenol hydroxylase-like FAD-dependent oxidoreductase